MLSLVIENMVLSNCINIYTSGCMLKMCLHLFSAMALSVLFLGIRDCMYSLLITHLLDGGMCVV